MTDASIERTGRRAPLVRYFGWTMLFLLAAHQIANFLTVAYDFPGAFDAFSGGSAGAWTQLVLLLVALILPAVVVASSPDRSLRYEARRISDFNAYLIRAFFFGVFFVGVADAAIAFMRIEGMLVQFFPESVSVGLARASWTAMNVHVPLIVAGFVLALFTRSLGFVWLALLIVVAELLIVISRFVFSYEQAFMGDLVRYWYAALFLFASAHTLLAEGHVRVDVLYSGFSERAKGRANTFGTLLLGIVTAWTILYIGFDGPQSLINAPVRNFEISQSGPAGMYIKYQMAAFLGIFAATMLIQFVAYLFEAFADWRDEPGRVERDGTAAH
ncbi:TRAP transporter small permease subunit [Anianabacter salinae]|uniref:TRAP transporter small permease subunit n=1 Tax=Anianabacter salinae TaxID=2851023 RepID=UPI00225DDF4D|nr:TRAP transporter small permease subunit [Anianabacter salinae]MBV0911132.1 TRAP transporter small permease subunit [Anianabacter salinae]